MNRVKVLIGTCFVALFCSAAQAQTKLTLADPFTDHMVLQQKADAAIWGWGNPTETVSIVGSWNEKDTVRVRVGPLGEWRTGIATPEAGGPYTLTVWGSGKIELKDVLIGEVWLCSGQSNMQWSHTHPISNREKEVSAANHPNLRIFHIPRLGADVPQNHCDAEWTKCNSETMTQTSAIGYFFGRELMQQMDVPVGIIVSAWGGTPAEVWIPEEVFTTNPTLNDTKIATSKDWPRDPGVLYNQMINPVVPYSLSGAIWYQGESNVDNAHSYGLMMTRLIESWRGAFRNELPFYFVQIAPFNYPQADSLAATLREQQELTAGYVPQSGMVVISDLVDNVSDIHPQNKVDVGIRLANMAMAEVYDLDIKSYQSPTYREVEFKDGKAYVSFNDVLTELEIRGDEAVGFMISGADGVFVPARASVKKDVLIVEATQVREPTAVRYCFDNATIGNVFSTEGLPVAPFRSDSRSGMLQ